MIARFLVRLLPFLKEDTRLFVDECSCKKCRALLQSAVPKIRHLGFCTPDFLKTQAAAGGFKKWCNPEKCGLSSQVVPSESARVELRAPKEMKRMERRSHAYAMDESLVWRISHGQATR